MNEVMVVPRVIKEREGEKDLNTSNTSRECSTTLRVFMRDLSRSSDSVLCLDYLISIDYLFLFFGCDFSLVLRQLHAYHFSSLRLSITR